MVDLIGSARAVCVVVAQPVARLVASLGGAVEPLVHAPEPVQSAGIGGVGVIDDAVFEHECAHAGPFSSVGAHVGAGHGGTFRSPVGRRPRACLGPCPATRMGGRRALVVVVGGTLPLLLFGDRDLEIKVEVAAERGRYGNVHSIC